MRKSGHRSLNLVPIPTPEANMKEIPVPLRQQHSKPTSPQSNKRTLAARSNLPSPTIAKMKHASGLVNGVMQAMPHINRRSQSDSFSRLSVSSHNSHASIDILSGSCSNLMFDEAVASLSNKEHGVVT
nr:serine/threonine-protein phosphatase 6 regulatory ankyrin repeat subunit C [Tanacetum cinerariifolium]